MSGMQVNSKRFNEVAVEMQQLRNRPAQDTGKPLTPDQLKRLTEKTPLQKGFENIPQFPSNDS